MMTPYSTCITSFTKMVDMIASNHISELSVPASTRALLIRESSVGGVSYKVKNVASFREATNNMPITEPVPVSEIDGIRDLGFNDLYLVRRLPAR